MTDRGQFTAEFTTYMAFEPLSGAESSAELCREHDLQPQCWLTADQLLDA